MKKGTRLLLLLSFLALIIIAWVIVLSTQSDSDKQLDLLEQARAYMSDKIYILAVPLLEEAAGYNAAYTDDVEEELKTVYLKLIEQKGFRNKYISLLEKQMSRKDALPEIFYEAANYYLGISKNMEAYAVLKNGIERTGNKELIILYEDNRYAFTRGYEAFDNVTVLYGNTIGVCRDGLWGLADVEGKLLVPCVYEKISNFAAGRAFVINEEELFAIDRSNNRIALLKLKENEIVTDFGNFANDRLPVMINGKWYRTTGEFERGDAAFDWVGMHSDGYAAAVQDGKWGVIDRSAVWVIPAQYDEIICDELGRAWGQGAVFARQSNTVILLVDGIQVGGTYEDARPFGDEGYAAVMKNGKWGFIDITGEVKVPYEFDDALSFGQHLAAVKVGDLWGYIRLFDGEIAIEPSFLQAKSFSNGSAPVLTDRGWQFISLLEYKQSASF